MDVLPIDGVCVGVRSGRGNPELLHATDSIIAQLAELQFTLGEGPGLDAYRTRSAVVVPNLASDAAFSRWSAFVRQAAGIGASAIFAFPLLIGTVSFGTVELYRIDHGPLPEPDSSVTFELVDEMVHAVLDDLSGHGPLEPSETISSPLFGRHEVSVATGMIAVQLGVPIPQALAELRASAFAEQRPIQDIAHDVMSRRRRFTNRRG